MQQDSGPVAGHPLSIPQLGAELPSRAVMSEVLVTPHQKDALSQPHMDLTQQPWQSPSQLSKSSEHSVTLALFQHIYIISLSRNVFGLV